MRIALVRQRYSTFGGAERFVNITMQALREQNLQFTLVTRKWDDQTNYPVLICDPFYIGNAWRDWSFARAVCAALKINSFDLVQSHERIACCDIYRAGDGVHREWLKQRSRVLSSLRKITLNINPYHCYVLNAEKRLFNSSQLKAVICNSNMVKTEIQHYFGVPAEKLHVIYNAVDSKIYHPGLKSQHGQALRKRYSIPDDAVVFLFVGSGFERKGLKAMLQAMSRSDYPNHYLLVVGKDKRQQVFKKLAEQMHISERVIFAGGQQDTRPFYGAADVFVLPTLYDPFPNAALEAFACGLPVITSTKSGAAELIITGKNGFACDPLDISSLGDFLNHFPTRESAAILSGNCVETVKGLTSQNMSERLYELYRSILARQ